MFCIEHKFFLKGNVMCHLFLQRAILTFNISQYYLYNHT